MLPQFQPCQYVTIHLPFFIHQSYLVCSPNMDADNRMIEVFLCCLEQGPEMWLGSQDELEDL